RFRPIPSTASDTPAIAHKSVVVPEVLPVAVQTETSSVNAAAETEGALAFSATAAPTFVTHEHATISPRDRDEALRSLCDSDASLAPNKPCAVVAAGNQDPTKANEINVLINRPVTAKVLAIRRAYVPSTRIRPYLIEKGRRVGKGLCDAWARIL